MTTEIVVNQPNEYALTTGKETFITYSTSSKDGIPLLDYKTSSSDERHFSGDEIDTMQTDIGTLLTVIIDKANPDFEGEEVKLSLLIPIVTLLPGNNEKSIETLAILTTEYESGKLIVGAGKVGQLQTYKVLPLKGTASLVKS